MIFAYKVDLGGLGLLLKVVWAGNIIGGTIIIAITAISAKSSSEISSSWKRLEQQQCAFVI